MDTPAVRTDERIVAFLQLLWKPGEVHEFRAPKHDRFKHTASGYFDSPQKLAEAASSWDGRANLYFTLNPVSPALLARANNRINADADNTSADADVVERRWLFIDVDPARPSGISSTDSERQAAFDVLSKATGWLAEQGWSAPITAMSGNGYYGLYAIDLPNDPQSTELLKPLLESLASRFNSEGAHIDTTVYNASRIIGLIGTKKMKGDATADRPHRISELLSVPQELGVVTEAQLRALLPEKPATAARPSERRDGKTRALSDILNDHSIEYRAQSPDANGVTWYHVRRCPFHEDGREFECGVGQKLPDGPYAGHGFHPECSNKGWRDWKLALGLQRPAARFPEAKTRDTTPLVGAGEFHLTDAGNGELFARLYGDRLRYDHRRKQWLVWAGHWWQEDVDGEVRRLAKLAARQRYSDAIAIEDLDARTKESKFAIGSENRSRLESMLLQAQTEHPIAVAGDSWNGDQFRLGAANGVVDLQTGELRSGDPEDRITKHSTVAFDQEATCPRWLQFLKEVFRDEDLVDYIWRAVGYSLTGDISDQSVFMCYGTGANGKSVFLAVLRELLGDYAFNAPFATFELHSRSSIPNDLAALVDRRLVTASETNEDVRLNEGRLKSLTGGDPTTARFLHGEYFTYQPVGKFWLAVNHRPKVNDDSHGFWRRVRLIPFTHRFTSDADPLLIEKLRQEYAGILAWAVHGCLEWQRRGLAAPTLVTAATEAYRSESDALASFLEECCVTSEDISVGATEIAKAYQSWAMRSGMRQSEVLTSTTFGRRMSERFSKQHTKTGNVYRGVGLLTQRSQELPPTSSVKGLVKGFESNDGKTTLIPEVEKAHVENIDLAFTTLHPSPADEENCADCGGEVWATDAAGTPLCQEHATAEALP